MVKKDTRKGGGPEPKRSRMNERAFEHLFEGPEPKDKVVLSEDKQPVPEPIPVVQTNKKMILDK